MRLRIREVNETKNLKENKKPIEKGDYVFQSLNTIKTMSPEQIEARYQLLMNERGDIK